MAISWTTKKQFAYFVVFLLAVAGIFYFFWFKVTAPTCFDNKQNQGEDEIDCGGPCKRQCLGEIKDIIVLWSKVVALGGGKYEAVALVKNPNLFLALPSLKYQFKFYDENNLLVAARDGETFVNPGEDFVIFDTGIDSGKRVPKRAFVEFEENLRWERLEKEKNQIVVSKKEFVNTPFPRLSVVLENMAVSAVRDIYAIAVLYDGDENVKAVSSTLVDFISGGGSENMIFTWPESFVQEPYSSEVFFRTNLTRQ